MQLLGRSEIARQVTELWPETRLIAADRLARIDQLRALLDTQSLAEGDVKRGSILFEKTCASCHTLFGKGAAIGPELTGAQRDNLVYWLENIVDPSATVAANFRLSIVVTNDGRVLNGVIEPLPGGRIALQTATDRQMLARNEIEEIVGSEYSLMPDGLLDLLDTRELVDLFAYLMSNTDAGGLAN